MKKVDYQELINNIKNYKLIGKGDYRSVYDVGNGLVLKVAHENIRYFEGGCQSNFNEFNFYNAIKDKEYFCPSYWVSEDGKYQVMANATYLELPLSFRTKERFIKSILMRGADEDVQSNRNWVNNYLVDYNNFLLD